MVRQERDRRGPEPGGDPQEPRHLAEQAPTEARRRAAEKIFAHEERLAEKRDKALVRPGFRERVEQLMRERWHEPVIVLRLGDADLGFDVPGRRHDGTIAGKGLVGQFFRKILRGIGAAVLYVLYLANGAGSGGGKLGSPFRREIRVTGPENALVLELTDRLRGAGGPWLVCSPTRVAVVDTGVTFRDPADAPPPRILWEASGSPEVGFRKRTLTWADGSVFRFPLHGRTEEQHLRKYVEAPDIVHWTRAG